MCVYGSRGHVNAPRRRRRRRRVCVCVYNNNIMCSTNLSDHPGTSCLVNSRETDGILIGAKKIHACTHGRMFHRDPMSRRRGTHDENFLRQVCVRRLSRPVMSPRV